jgi:hypothetical protein
MKIQLELILTKKEQRASVMLKKIFWRQEQRDGYGYYRRSQRKWTEDSRAPYKWNSE